MNRSRFFLGMAAIAVLLLSAGAASAQTPANVTVVSGNGQLICPNCVPPNTLFFQPLYAKVTDTNGNPIGLTPVSWTITAGAEALQFAGGAFTTTTYTDANGLTSVPINQVNQGIGSIFNPFVQSTIVATAGNSSATFNVTQGVQTNPAQTGDKAQNPFVFRIPDGGSQLTQGTLYTGQVGSRAATPIKIQVVTNISGNPVPNVAVRIVNTVPGTSTMTCAEQAGAGVATVLTDSTGTATCYPIFGGVPNQDGAAYVSVGGANNPYDSTFDQIFVTYPFPGYFLVVRSTPGIPGALRLISGNGQTQTSGLGLTAPLVVQVQSSAGNPLAGQTINWTISPANAGTLGSRSSSTDTNGNASNTLTLASGASGPVTVTASLQGSSLPAVTFNVTASSPVTLTGLAMISGNNQSALANAGFGAPLVVQLNASNGPASGQSVAFTVSGPATLSANSVTTGSNGQASVNVQAGGTAGNVTVTAAAGGFTQTFNLVVSPPGPSLTAAGFMNAADFQRGSLSPCSLATVIGNGLAPGLQGMVTGGLIPGLQFQLANDTVTVGGSQAPLYAVGLNTATNQQQVTFQVPCDVTPGSSVPVTVTVGAGTATINIPIQAASPGVFQYTMSDNVNRAILIRPDGSLVSLANPARRGENLTAYVTGLGAAVTPLSTGGVAPMGVLISPRGTVVVGMAGRGVPVVGAQLSEDLVGVWLVTFTVPSDVSASNNTTFSISVIPAGATAPIASATTTVPVQ